MGMRRHDTDKYAVKYHKIRVIIRFDLFYLKSCIGQVQPTVDGLFNIITSLTAINILQISHVINR